MKNNPAKIIYFIFFIACLKTNSYGQGNWRQGYIVKENGDTLNGLVNYREESKSERIILFKKEKDNEPITYIKNEIAEIDVYQNSQKLIFKKIIALIDYSPIKLSDLESNSLVRPAADTVLAQVILEGKKSLYHYKDPLMYKNHYFTNNELNEIIELRNKRFFFDKNKTYAVYSEEFKKQILTLFTNCDLISEKLLEGLKFTDIALTDLVLKYNKCNGEKVKNYIYKIERNQPEFGILLGGNQMSLTVKSDISNYGKLKFNKSSGINAGVFMNCYLYRTRKKWSLYNELLFANYKVKSEGYYIYFEGDDYYKKLVSGEFKASYIKLFSALRFQNFISGNIKPFVQIGIGNSIAVQSSSKANYETRFYSNMYTEDSTLFDFRKYEFSYFASAGINYKKYGIEARYESGNGMSKISAVATHTKYLYFLVSYKF